MVYSVWLQTTNINKTGPEPQLGPLIPLLPLLAAQTMNIHRTFIGTWITDINMVSSRNPDHGRLHSLCPQHRSWTPSWLLETVQTVDINMASGGSTYHIHSHSLQWNQNGKGMKLQLSVFKWKERGIITELSLRRKLVSTIHLVYSLVLTYRRHSKPSACCSCWAP